jgi:hypothetical protein
MRSRQQGDHRPDYQQPSRVMKNLGCSRPCGLCNCLLSLVMFLLQGIRSNELHVSMSTLQLTPFCLGLHTNDVDKLSLKDEHRVGRDRTHGSGAVARLGLNCECPLLARAHAQNALVPALDNLALANVERQRLAAVVGCVEFGAVGLEGAAVVDVDFVACLEFSFCLNVVVQ